MKTTIEIDDDLLKAAKKRAIDEGTTLRALVEEGLFARLHKQAVSRASAEKAERLGALFETMRGAAIAEGRYAEDAGLSATPSREEIYADRMEQIEAAVDAFRSGSRE